MWDKLNFFNWSKKKPTVQAVQREISVTLTNGDRRETIQRSPSGTKLASSSSTKHGLDEDNSSEASTSLNFGFKAAGSSPRRNSSYSFSREPLDLPTWSNVTSPGFTSRLVQQASGNSPLKEFNDSLSHSPFRKSPYKDLKLGELPYPSYNTFSRKPSAHVFPSPQRASSLRSGVSSSVYNRDRRKNARQGQTFVRIAPIDPSVKANLSLSRKSSSPPLGINGGPYSPRGSPRTGNESYRQEGLGGIPQQELAMRFNRLWPSSPGGPVPGPGRPSSPTSPSHILEVLTAGRKRTRDQDTYYPPNATPPSVSPPSKISIGIGDTPVRPQVSKRVKFLGGPEGRDRPMMVGYSGLGAGDGESLSSESILEQMNQTEKRFLPDSTSTPYSLQKKNIRMPGVDDQPSALHSALRKRRSQTSVMSAVEDEARGEKAGRFCTCNECYAEAAGMSSPDHSFQKGGSTSPRASDEKSTNTGDSRSKDTCDKGVSTTEFDRGAYFREVFRKADKKKPAKDDEDMEELMPFGKTVITKEMYEKDKRKRIERYYRMLKMKPPGGNIFDPCPGDSKPSTSASTATITTSVVDVNDGPSTSSAVVTESNNPPPYNFGSPPSTSSGGFSFGKQTSPVAPTVTTSACSTITSPSSSSGFGMGSGTLSSTAPTSSMSGNTPFGIGVTPSTANSTVAPALEIPSFGSPTAASSELKLSTVSSVKPFSPVAKPSDPCPITTTSGSGGFSFGSNTASTPFGSNTTAPTSESSSNPPAFGSNATTTTSGSVGFSFGGNTASTAFGSNVTTTGGSSSNPPAFGAPSMASVPLFGQTMTPSTTTAGSFGASFGSSTANTETGTGDSKATTPASTITPIIDANDGPSSAVTTQSNNNPPPYNFGAPSSATGGFSFGKQTSAVAPTVTTSSCSTITSSSSSTGFGMGQGSLSSTAPSSMSANTPFGIAATPTTTNSTVVTLGIPSFGSPSAAGQLKLSSFSSPKPFSTLAKPSDSGPTTTSGSGGFSFGGNIASSPFGSSATTTTGGSSNPPAFGSSTSTTTGASSNPPAFGAATTAPLFGQAVAQPAPTAGSFGRSFGSSAATASTGFSFGGTAASTPFVSNNNNNGNATGGTSNPPAFGAATAAPIFGQTTAPSTTSAGSFGTSFGSSASTPANTGFSFGGSTTSTPFVSNNNNSSSTGTSGTTNPPAFGAATAAPLFGQAMAPSTTTTGSFGTSFGSSAPAPANTGFSFGGNTAPAQGAAGSTPFQFGQQAAQGVPGGFNFAASAPAPSPGGGQPMFSMGSASTAPRRRDVRRRHR